MRDLVLIHVHVSGELIGPSFLTVQTLENVGVNIVVLG